MSEQANTTLPKWTESPPTVPGVYWWRHMVNGRLDEGPRCFELEAEDGKLVIYGFRADHPEDIPDCGEWYGPLEAPR